MQGLSQARAILKRRYDKGRVPMPIQTATPIVASTPRFTDDGGDDVQQAIQSGTPQAASSQFQTAYDDFVPSTFAKLNIDMVQYYSLARIAGRLMGKAAVQGEKAMLDLVKREVDGAAKTLLKEVEIQLTRNGSGMKGQLKASQTLSATTLALRNGYDIINFALNEKFEAWSAESLSATKRTHVSGPVRITGWNSDPNNPNITIGANWSSLITDLTSDDFLARAGDGPTGGAPNVIYGLDVWAEGGASPSALGGLTRTTAPVQYAGQQYDASPKGYEEAMIDAEALLGFQVAEGGDNLVLLCNTIDAANLKKVAASRMSIDRMKSAVAGLSFQTVKIAGDYGEFRMIVSPYVRKGRAYLGDIGETVLESQGEIPRMINWGSESNDAGGMLTVVGDDAAEARWGAYLRYRCRNPARWVRILNWGGA